MSVNSKLKEMRKRLEEEKTRITTELDSLKVSGQVMDTRREGSPFGKREEEATEALELEKRLMLENKLNDQLNAVEHALDKIKKGTYGLCDRCGQPIEWARLDALPQANLCMKCKAEMAKSVR